MQSGCRRCHTECLTCDGSGNNMAGEDYCKCKHFVNDNQCVPHCPLHHYNDSTGQCHKCHEECVDCYGPMASDCTRCHGVRVYEEADEIGALSYNESSHMDSTVEEYKQTDLEELGLNDTDIERIPSGKVCASLKRVFRITYLNLKRREIILLHKSHYVL